MWLIPPNWYYNSIVIIVPVPELGCIALSFSSALAYMFFQSISIRIFCRQKAFAIVAYLQFPTLSLG